MSISDLELDLTRTESTRHRRKAGTFYQLAGKRLFDLVLLAFLAPFALPVIVISALLVAICGGNPFFRQARVGHGGKTFHCYKIRTMVPDANAVLEQVLAENPDLAAEWERDQKLRNDPRVTTIGKVLRKTSLDELPQLWNVLAGDMSLVGARPFTPQQQDLYDRLAANDRYYMFRPGLSGLWQVSCRNDGDFLQRVETDGRYFENVTLFCDLRILWQTIWVVARATGC